MTTRFPKGITNAWAIETLGNMGQPDPTKFNTYFDDFNTFLASDWVITAVGTGTTALTPGDGGQLLVTTSAAAPDSRSHQLAVATFTFTAGKHMFFKAAGSLSNATLSVLQIGLVITDTTPLDATDGIYFLKPAATANIGIFCRRDATTGNRQNLNVAQLTTGYTIFGFEYDGKETVNFYINDSMVGSLECGANNSPDAPLTVTFHVGNGDAVARTFNLDYILAAKER
jgi:hypothetical protein